MSTNSITNNNIEKQSYEYNTGINFCYFKDLVYISHTYSYKCFEISGYLTPRAGRATIVFYFLKHLPT